MDPQGNCSGSHFSYKTPAFSYSKQRLCKLPSSAVIIIKIKTSKLWVKVLLIHDLLYFDLHYAKSYTFKPSYFLNYFRTNPIYSIVLFCVGSKGWRDGRFVTPQAISGSKNSRPRFVKQHPHFGECPEAHPFSVFCANGRNGKPSPRLIF